MPLLMGRNAGSHSFMDWHPDILGDGFEACSFEAAGDDGVARTATLVR